MKTYNDSGDEQDDTRFLIWYLRTMQVIGCEDVFTLEDFQLKNLSKFIRHLVCLSNLLIGCTQL